MRRQKRRDTGPELDLRRLLHAQGFRYRVDTSVIAGSRRRHDLVFPNLKVAVEVRGCFWHRCPVHGTSPKANDAWWAAKLAKNVERDADTARQLADAGWELVVVWEHEDARLAAERVASIVGARRRMSRRSR
jgi:DNA mismatch endonuclease (patch repair protein)